MYHYKPFKATPNANHMKRSSPPPQPHQCACHVCGTEYLGFGRLCKTHQQKQNDAQALARLESAAILETRINQPKPQRVEVAEVV